ncbi:MAG: hypothetical protein E6845_17310 [Clostridium sp.]|uniref:hypothetical protein n=1 Tax=Clostridium sp. TaxID=1506 RepID=UPI002901A5A7|nr:hypothetical protein [Clostridium sp.]MDU1604718.1 hypothetical protein [Clostridium sp.]
MKVLNIIIKYIMFLISYSPIFCLSDDKNFGSNEDGIKDFISRIRLSLLSLNLGAYKYYFISIKKNNGFKFIHVINLEKYFVISDVENNRLRLLQANYLNTAVNLDNDKEFLSYLLSNENGRQNVAFSKINIYSGIMLALVPLLLIFFKLETLLKAAVLVKILTFILVYLMLNVICLIFQFSKVSEMSREKYSDLKQSSDKEKSLIKAYYLDWQHLKKEADSAVSFVKNIEKYIKGLILLSILIVSFNYMNEIRNSYSSKATLNSIVEINVDSLEKKQKEEVNKINSINEQIADKRVIQVIILYNNDDLLDNKSFKSIKNYFSIYRSENEIKLIKEDSEDKDNKIKVILVEA